MIYYPIKINYVNLKGLWWWYFSSLVRHTYLQDYSINLLASLNVLY